MLTCDCGTAADCVVASPTANRSYSPLWKENLSEFDSILDNRRELIDLENNLLTPNISDSSDILPIDCSKYWTMRMNRWTDPIHPSLEICYLFNIVFAN